MSSAAADETWGTHFRAGVGILGCGPPCPVERDQAVCGTVKVVDSPLQAKCARRMGYPLWLGSQRSIGERWTTRFCAQSSTSLQLQKALERLHHASNRTRVQNECLRYVHAASKLPILDNYVRGELALLCDVLSIWEVDAIRRSLGSAEVRSWPPFARFIPHLNSANMALCQNRDKESVFVSVCEAVNGPDGGIPSVARLYLVNDEFEEVRASSVHISLSQCALKFFDGFVNGELGPIPGIGRNESFNCLQPCVVEGAV